VKKLLFALVLFFSTPAFAFEWTDYVKDSMSGVAAYEFLEIGGQTVGGKWDAYYFWNIISPSVGYITTIPQDEKAQSAWGIGGSAKLSELAKKMELPNPLEVFKVPVGLNVGYGTGKKVYLWIHAEIL